MDLKLFFSEYWLFLTIVGSLVGLIILAYLLYVHSLRKAKANFNLKEKPHKLNEKFLDSALKEEKLKVEEPSLPQEFKQPPTKKLQEEPKEIVTKKVVEIEVSPKTTLPEEIIQIEASPKVILPDENIQIEASPKAKKHLEKKASPKKKQARRKLGIFQVIYREKDKRWIVQREGASRALRVFKNKNEAIDYAMINSLLQKSSFTIIDN